MDYRLVTEDQDFGGLRVPKRFVGPIRPAESTSCGLAENDLVLCADDDAGRNGDVGWYRPTLARTFEVWTDGNLRLSDEVVGQHPMPLVRSGVVSADGRRVLTIGGRGRVGIARSE
ncbi:MAG: hypothetical protein HYV07_32275 [Deltaproteobacteria bacterium]|nr:hypothetical protein [Deltaproteobacteria bacterium]